MTRVPVQPAVFTWARQCARLDDAVLAARFPHLAAWLFQSLESLRGRDRRRHGPRAWATIRLMSAVALVATKLEAFAGRGGGDFMNSHDLEDVLNIIVGRD